MAKAKEKSKKAAPKKMGKMKKDMSGCGCC